MKADVESGMQLYMTIAAFWMQMEERSRKGRQKIKLYSEIFISKLKQMDILSFVEEAAIPYTEKR